MGICGNAFERIGQMLNSNQRKTSQTITIKCKCPQCGNEFDQKHEIAASGISTNLNFQLDPGTHNPWRT